MLGRGRKRLATAQARKAIRDADMALQDMRSTFDQEDYAELLLIARARHLIAQAGHILPFRDEPEPVENVAGDGI